jgi:glycosyltransferase involved in cell wall biosynthesis
MTKNIVLLNTAHGSLDDRVFYHQARSLFKNGNHVTIVSTVDTMETIKEDIHICSSNLNIFSRKDKQQKIVEILVSIKPDIVICDTPIAILSSHKYSRKNKIKTIYDVTEWYPLVNNLKDKKGLKRWIRYFILYLFYLYAGAISNGFIFGEYYKSKVFRFLYFWKPYNFVSYFPDLRYIETSTIKDIQQSIKLFYGGNIQPEGGLQQIVQSVIKAAEMKSETVFHLHVICNLSDEKEVLYFEKLTSNFPSNIEVHRKGFLSYTDFCQYITDMDLFFDLRAISFENNHSLPIKLFYYLACGRPIIYSKLKSITTFFPDISFGYLVNPADSDLIADHIINYIDNPSVYSMHCKNALKLSQEKYNWTKIESNFIDFIRKFSNQS